MAEAPRTYASFTTAAALGAWLRAHHGGAAELWVRIYKRASGVASVTWDDCVVEAITVGWIDGRREALDGESFLQRLTPRRPRSNWSARNREHATRLIAEGRMTPAGLAQVEAARTDGRWDGAYSGSAGMSVPQDVLDALERMPAAKASFNSLGRSDLYAIYYRLQTAKRPDTRAKRLAQILAQLERGERIR